MKVEFKAKEKAQTLRYDQLEPGKFYRVVSIQDGDYVASGYMDHILLAVDLGDTRGVYGIWVDYGYYCYLSKAASCREYLCFEEFNCKLVEV